MTSRGRLVAFLIGITIAFMLPKKVECGHPGAHCGRIVDKRRCVAYEVEPFGFFLIETLVKSDVGFAYKTGEDC